MTNFLIPQYVPIVEHKLNNTVQLSCPLNKCNQIALIYQEALETYPELLLLHKASTYVVFVKKNGTSFYWELKHFKEYMILGYTIQKMNVLKEAVDSFVRPFKLSL
ncbi:hypothetical protein, partial [Paenibacillus foliorum]|uniref:hypothetical protein n=1 Tax=Paenibacillus foliorum TaxID=2654974 RepID=UPI001C0FEF2C